MAKIPTYAVTLELKTSAPPRLVGKKSAWNLVIFDSDIYAMVSDFRVTIKSLTVKEGSK